MGVKGHIIDNNSVRIYSQLQDIMIIKNQDH